MAGLLVALSLESRLESQRQFESQGRAIVGIVSGGGRMDKPVLKAGQRPSLSF